MESLEVNGLGWGREKSVGWEEGGSAQEGPAGPLSHSNRPRPIWASWQRGGPTLATGLGSTRKTARDSEKSNPVACLRKAQAPEVRKEAQKRELRPRAGD